ncbi:MAG: C69 family dipeptidase [Coriobacteriales bacterium]|nr:C69 family dipeptidase [Coriobacteriales bacterium]
MPCTTILVGKRASNDGSTIVARNDDSYNGEFTPKRLAVVLPDEQPRTYTSVIGHLSIKLPDNPMRYTSMPNALPGEGIWAAAGINEANVGMSATETITSNGRVLAADPLVVYQPAQGTPGDADYQPEQAGGIGEEDMVTLVLPYIRSAREGVLRLGSLLERFGTYEMNGIAFHDTNEIWWLETVGGHHWIARRVPDDCYVAMANQLGIDWFDLADAEGRGRGFLCSQDLRSFVEKNSLDLTIRDHWGIGSHGEPANVFNPRLAFGSASDSDHVYNTPRTWAIQRYLNPRTSLWDGPDADYEPTSDDIPWCRVPERAITMEGVKHALSLHYQGTPYDPYGTTDPQQRYRPIGINRTSQLSATQLRGDLGKTLALHWIAFGSNPFNALVPLFANVDAMPAYFSTTDAEVSTKSFYWANRLIGALADASYKRSLPHVERYQKLVISSARRILVDATRNQTPRKEANEHIARMVHDQTEDLLAKVLYEASMGMRNAFSRSDN